MAKKKDRQGSWVVRLKVERIIEITTDACTEAEARADPFKHQDGCDEQDIDTINWEVQRVEPNE